MKVVRPLQCIFPTLDLRSICFWVASFLHYVALLSWLLFR